LQEEEITILVKDFSDGVIDPFSHHYYKPGASYEVLSPEEDPLAPLNGQWCVRLRHPDEEFGRSSLAYAHLEQKLGTARVIIHWMTPFAEDPDLTGVFCLMNQEAWSYIVWLRVLHSRWRIEYLHNGTLVKEYFGAVEPNRKYKLEIRIKLGAGDGEIEVYVDDVLAWSKGELNNVAGGAIDRIEVGTIYGSPSLEVYIYDVAYYGTIMEFATVTGQPTENS